jgi:hypothetical protein
MTQKDPSLFDWNIVGPAIGDAFKKLDPRLMIKNPVMFVTMVGAVLTSLGIFTSPTDRGFIAQLAVWLWFTVLFANFAEAVAEGRGKAQADALRKARKDIAARRLRNGREEKVAAPDLQKGDLVVDPYLGVGTCAVAAVLHGRRAAGADIKAEYLAIARHRIKEAVAGRLKRRPFGKPVYEPSPNTPLTISPFTATCIVT